MRGTFPLAPEKGLVKMDTYCEYIVKKKNGGKELALRALIVLGAVALFVVFMLLGGVVRSFSMITTLLAFGSLYMLGTIRATVAAQNK